MSSRVMSLVGLASLGTACLDSEGRESSIYTSMSGYTVGNEGAETDEGVDADSDATDGDPTSGDGDGVPSGDGDGDGDPSGDGDGDPSGDGDGDGDPVSDAVCSSVGAVSHAGTGGSVTANQNCPSTDFDLHVANSPGPVADVEVEINGVAANTSQNRLWLIGPSGTEVLLFNRRGTAFTDDWIGTYFDDESPMPVASAPGPFHGCFRPEMGLSAFDGQPADGAWTLRVETCLYETSITSWSLHLQH